MISLTLCRNDSTGIRTLNHQALKEHEALRPLSGGVLSMCQEIAPNIAKTGLWERAFQVLGCRLDYSNLASQLWGTISGGEVTGLFKDIMEEKAHFAIGGDTEVLWQELAIVQPGRDR